MNITVNVINNEYHLVDNNNQTVFKNTNWDVVEKHAYASNLNIVYSLKDLVFDINTSDEPYVEFDVKYSIQGHGNLGHHNVVGLPDYISEVEAMECIFDILTDDLTDKEIIDDLVQLGATHKVFI